MKNFTSAHIVHITVPTLKVVQLTDLVHAPLHWQLPGLYYNDSLRAQRTSQYKLCFEGRLYRIYHTGHVTLSSAYINVKGKHIYLS